MKCSECSAERETTGERLPKGWKRAGEAVHCDKCWRGAFVLRAITLPVVGPVCKGVAGSGKDEEPLGWPAYREMLRESWIATTQAANYMVRQMALSDPGLDPETGKALKMPKQYHYPEVRRRWPLLSSCSANCLEQAAQGKYRKVRRELLTFNMSLPTMRYPVPLPIHCDTWKVWEDEGGRLLLTHIIGNERITVRLQGGAQHVRQRMGLRKVMAGLCKQGELSIYRVNAQPGDNRNGIQGTRVMAKMVAWMPREEERAGSVAALHTGGDAFLTLYDAGKNMVFRWNADHLKRRIDAHDDQLQRLREDLKAERRLRRDRSGIVDRMGVLSENHNKFVDQFCHQAAKEVVEMLVRRKANPVMFVEDTKSPYLAHFPWFKFKNLLLQKAEMRGITVATGDASAEVVKETPEPLEDQD